MSLRSRSLLTAAVVAAVSAPWAALADPTAVALRRWGTSAVDLLAPRRTMVVTLPAHLDARVLGLVEVVPGIAVLEGNAARLAGFAAAHPEFDLELRPPLRPKLDLAGTYVGFPEKPKGTPGDGGAGVIIGIIDTGVDLSLDDFKNEDGTTRALYFLDGSVSKYDTLEEGSYLGRIYDQAALNVLLAKGGDAAPTDKNGHGTHVAGIALGNGGKPPARYFGVAPKADLIVVRAGSADGALDEGKVLLGAKFVFDKAAALGKPAVVNLSLGTQFGAHDGSSALERGLSALGQGKGRAVVVAASNEGNSPIHTSVRLYPTGKYEIPVRLPGSDGAGAAYNAGSVFVWINARDGGSFSVGVKADGKELLAPVGTGEGFAASPRADLTVTAVNDIPNGKPIPAGTHGAVVVLRGALMVGDFSLVLEGAAAAELWLQGDGQAGDGKGAAYFPRGAQLEGSIGVPASTAGVIAVGCVMHREIFSDRLGRGARIPDAAIGKRCAYSSSGPNALGQLRPDVLAPGHFVLSTLARNAVAAGAVDEGSVVDPDHAALAGTSMSSPFAAGAAAVLLQRDPTLRLEELRALLQAGARPLADDTPTGSQDYAKGAGILNVQGALAALERKTAAGPRAASLQLRLSASYLAADGALPLYGLALAKDAEGKPADIDGGMRLEIAGGVLVRDELAYVAPGLYRFSVVAAKGHGLEKGTITVRGSGLFATRTLPIGADRWDARDGLRVGGGCTTGGDTSFAAVGWLAMVFVLAARRRSLGRKLKASP